MVCSWYNSITYFSRFYLYIIYFFTTTFCVFLPLYYHLTYRHHFFSKVLNQLQFSFYFFHLCIRYYFKYGPNPFAFFFHNGERVLSYSTVHSTFTFSFFYYLLHILFIVNMDFLSITILSRYE